MKILSSIIVTIFLASAAASAQSNSWKGLTPLVSSRTDVEKIFGKPKNNPGFLYETYDTQNERAFVIYSKDTCSDGWNVPKETVLELDISSKDLFEKSFDDLNLDKSKLFSSFDDAMFGKWTDPEAGLQYNFSRQVENLVSIRYIPKRSDNSLRCDGFPPFTPEAQYFTMDQYRFYDKTLSKKENIERVYSEVDGFLIEVQNWRKEPIFVAYIMVYFDNNASFKKYKSRLDKFKDHIFKLRKMPADEITIIEGGLRKTSAMEFYLVPKGWKPPAPDPAFPSPQFMKKK